MAQTTTYCGDLINQIERLRAEASNYKTVRVSWLVANLDRILAGDGMAPKRCVMQQAGPKPIPLLRFLAYSSGLAPHAELTALDAHLHFVPGAGMLVRREGGLTLDYAREAAQQAGYLRDGCDIGDLLAAINDELNGRPVYRDADEGVMAWQHQNAEPVGEECPF